MNMKTRPIQILLIEDNPGDARLIQEILGEEKDVTFTLTKAKRLAEGIKLLTAGGMDVVLLDLSLPDSSGLETFIKIHTSIPNIPVIILSGLNDEDMALRAVHEGAKDYLVKGQVDIKLLVQAIQHAIL
jgi:CheY-like chemotaxis protein